MTSKRNTRQTLPLWRIKGVFELQTPLSIGTGEDEFVEIGVVKDVAVANIALDHKYVPYIPGSAIKGALRALAYKTGADTAVLKKIFGYVEKNETKPSQVEFCNAYGEGEFNQTTQTEFIPHSVRDRDYGTVVDRLFYYEKVVKPGYKFRFECTAQHLDATEIQLILGLLQLAGDQDHGIQLGGGKSGNYGRVHWKPANVSVQCLEKKGLATFCDQAAQENSTCSDLWAQAETTAITAETLKIEKNECLHLNNLKLVFHTPFLVYEANKNKKTGDADGSPRKNHNKQYILPSSSLHGALRSQAEKILRTLGQVTHEGYKVPSVMTTAEVDGLKNHAAILFGAPGWRAVVQCTDFEALPTSTIIKHEMLAIDRFTGGGKDGAKFCVEALDCPTLNGSIRIDLGRLRKLEIHNKNVVTECLGLLAHVLRDLDDGDIALGYGKAKGYGVSLNKTLEEFEKKLDKNINLGDCLKNFSDKFNNCKSDNFSPNINSEKTINFVEDRTISGDFYNPYVFIPFSYPDMSKKDMPWIGYDKLAKSSSSHSKYNNELASGRLLCRLETKTPIFIGASAADNAIPKKINNFKMKYDGLEQKIALPSTSLRGLFSSLHETLTASPVRVKNTDLLSPIQDTLFNRSLCATASIGVIKSKGGELYVNPLTVPALSYYYHYDDRAYYCQIPDYYNFFYQDENEQFYLYGKIFLNLSRGTSVKSDFYKFICNYHSNESYNEYWYMEVDKIYVDDENKCSAGDDKFIICDDCIAIGQNSKGKEPISSSEYKNSNDEEYKLQLTRGFLRKITHSDGLLGANHYDAVFVPHPHEFEPEPCDESCISTFLNNKNENASSVKPRDFSVYDGELVYFRTSENGEKIEKIEYIASLSEFNLISPTELLFGFVNDEILKNNDKCNKSFASKVRFGFGVSTFTNKELCEDSSVTLKILSTPKPPSPAMYYDYNGNYISKEDYKNNKYKYNYKGRKVYLHAFRKNGKVVVIDSNGYSDTGEPEKFPWITNNNNNNNQKVKVNLIKSDQEFFFEVDFNNLNNAELESLVATLTPTPNFEHKIGLGKPIGLGSVKISVIGLFLVNRCQRYLVTDLGTFKDKSKRYDKVWKSKDFPEKLPSIFELEKGVKGNLDDKELLVKQANNHMFKLSESNLAVYRALALTGKPSNVLKPVHYPQLANLNIEERIFDWFTNNENITKQQLDIFTSSTNKLPILSRPIQPAPRNRR